MTRLLPLLLVGCFVTRSELNAALDRDGDGFLPVVTGGDDCDETRGDVHPGADELCGDGVDNNCDGFIDDDGVGALLWYRDADDDGFGIDEVVTACSQPQGYAAAVGDCDDEDRAINPGVDDLCDGIDQNCDGVVDDDAILTERYRDADGDQVGTAEEIVLACVPVLGFVTLPGDCDDTNPEINPFQVDSCDGIDQDCDGVVDDDALFTVYYQDLDGDGSGDFAVNTTACAAPPGFVADALDCDDGDASVRPGALDVCDGIDQNCDGNIDDGGTFARWYQDVDGDGLGDSSISVDTCDGPLPGFVEAPGDCEPENSAVTLYQWFFDGDGDGHGGQQAIFACEPPVGFVALDDDCDDHDSARAPGLEEVCRTGVDEDCDDATDCRMRGVLETTDADLTIPLPPGQLTVSVIEDLVGSDLPDVLLMDSAGDRGTVFEGPITDFNSPLATLDKFSVCLSSASVDMDSDGDTDLVCGSGGGVHVFVRNGSEFERTMELHAGGQVTAVLADSPLGPGIWKGEIPPMRFFTYRPGVFFPEDADATLSTGGLPVVLPSCPGQQGPCLAVQDDTAVRIYAPLGEGDHLPEEALAVFPIEDATSLKALHLHAVSTGGAHVAYHDGNQLRYIDYTEEMGNSQPLTAESWASPATTLTIGDIDLDGFIDWRHRTGGGGEFGYELYYGSPSGLPDIPNAVFSTEIVGHTWNSDWNGDGYPDILTKTEENLYVYFGSGI